MLQCYVELNRTLMNEVENDPGQQTRHHRSDRAGQGGRKAQQAKGHAAQKDIEIKYLLNQALTDRINDRALFL